MGQEVTAIMQGLRGENLLDEFRDKVGYMWESVLAHNDPNRPFLSTKRDAFGHLVAVDRGHRDGEGDLGARTISFWDLIIEPDKTFPTEAKRVRARWEWLAKMLAAKGVALDAPMFLLTMVDRA